MPQPSTARRARPWRLLPLLLLALCLAAPALAGDAGALYQVSTIGALLQGDYQGSVSLEALLGRGDTGLGTVQGLDGELVVLGGHAYQVRVDGTVRQPAPETMTPFAQVGFFQADQTLELKGVYDLESLQAAVTQALPTPNWFYLLRVEGRFAQVKTRSVPGQQPPYPPLVEVVKNQAVFQFQDQPGDLVGLYSPPFSQGFSVPGWHLHFLTQARDGGGHVLGFSITDPVVRLSHVSGFEAALPHTESFQKAQLGAQKKEDLHKVEKDQ